MSAVNDGGPAFARPGANWRNADGDAMGCDAALGMSLRDYFAAKAMHQFLYGSVFPVGVDGSQEMASVANLSYAMADAMLKARGS